MLRIDYRVSQVFVIPALVSIAIFLFYPFIYSLVMSLGNLNLMKNAYTFTGLKNYIDLFKSSKFMSSLSVTLQFASIIVIFSTLLGLLFSLLLNQKFLGRSIGRAILILPWATPWVIIGIAWAWMLHSQFGSLNGLLFQLGLIEKYYPFLGKANSALLSTAFSAVWRQASFSAILLLATLQTIPQELYESGTIDGAGLFQKLFRITIPFLTPTLLVVLIINTLYGFMQFDTVFMMTGGGPGRATEIISIYMYRTAFEHLKLGQGAAVGYVLSLLCLFIGMFFVVLLRRSEKRLYG